MEFLLYAINVLKQGIWEIRVSAVLIIEYPNCLNKEKNPNIQREQQNELNLNEAFIPKTCQSSRDNPRAAAKSGQWIIFRL